MPRRSKDKTPPNYPNSTNEYGMTKEEEEMHARWDQERADNRIQLMEQQKHNATEEHVIPTHTRKPRKSIQQALSDISEEGSVASDKSDITELYDPHNQIELYDPHKANKRRDAEVHEEHSLSQRIKKLEQQNEVWLQCFIKMAKSYLDLKENTKKEIERSKNECLLQIQYVRSNVKENKDANSITFKQTASNFEHIRLAQQKIDLLYSKLTDLNKRIDHQEKLRDLETHDIRSGNQYLKDKVTALENKRKWHYGLLGADASATPDASALPALLERL